MVKKILLGVGVVLVAFLAFVATRPAKYRVVRDTVIKAPPAVVFAQLVDFHRWNAWSPWAKMDPNQEEDYEGAASGTGARYHWNGNDDVGEGRMEITRVEQDKRVDIKLDFIRPFPSSSTVDFVLAPEGDGTRVTWGMDGNNDFMGKLFGVFVDMDAMLGADFSKGLASMKDVAEKAGGAPAQAAPPG